MKKTAGFLLVLLLAILAIITTSSGVENDFAHQAHDGTALFGPQPGLSCTDCHDRDSALLPKTNPPYPYPYFKNLDSSGNHTLAETDICDLCHSPGGAYDGVNHPYIGAKNSWERDSLVSGVYDGSALKHSKEKWCVGCHDDDPSVVNGISAPNIAGDDVDYGYYKTGHGRGYGNCDPEGTPPVPCLSVYCLECHDPALSHVDGKARTYDADDDPVPDYQADYRLKSVGSYPPLVVPRDIVSETIDPDDFLLCFTCHDSEPFLGNNTDTNFRSDVNNSCESLDPPANMHSYHLQPSTLFKNKWDSDWDEKLDSMANCTACHNVHGPRLKDGEFITNAPAMIRTGELIGRTRSLNLEYYVNPCPDKTLSVTNELFDETNGNSTGGSM